MTAATAGSSSTAASAGQSRNRPASGRPGQALAALAGSAPNGDGRTAVRELGEGRVADRARDDAVEAQDAVGDEAGDLQAGEPVGGRHR